MSDEEKRLEEERSVWGKWGPYVSDRAWGTVREDYSESGDAWNFFPFSHAHKRTYRWGEDGIAGFCDRYQTLIFAPAFWNGKDPILKERFFGLTSSEGNHGEDVKEYYYHLDATPTHSYMKLLYKYPHEKYPYEKLLEENQKRSAKELEYELIDTKIFDEDKYFDIFIEYAKASPDDICIRITACNRSDQKATLTIIPQLFFRNVWSIGDKRTKEPIISLQEHKDHICLQTDDSTREEISDLHEDYRLGKRYFYGDKKGEPLFTNNETNREDLWNKQNHSNYLKDGFHNKIIHKQDTTHPNTGTKAGISYELEIDGKAEVELFFRLSDKPLENPFIDIVKIFETQKQQADLFYKKMQSEKASEEVKKVQRQAFAGMIWSKQIYVFDVSKWLQGDDSQNPPPEKRKEIRNIHWRHLNSKRVLSMPDKWEYPWFAAWDLAFHCVNFAIIDPYFAKEQLWFLLFDQFLHPNGQIPAYEWEFSDVNPPVQAWAALKIIEIEKKNTGKVDIIFLEKCFHKLLLNFSWWVNKVDSNGHNVFEGGFLGLDNITVLDRSAKMPGGGILDQVDGSGWMAMFCLNLMRIALILSEANNVYESLATKFFEHFIYIAAAMRKGYWRGYDLFDDGFFYSVLHYPDNTTKQLKIRSLEGVIPLFAAEVLKDEEIKKFPEFYQNFTWFIKYRSHLTDICVQIEEKDGEKSYLLSLLNKQEHEKALSYISDENEFLSDYGIRSISKYHEKNPFTFNDSTVGYEPGESLEKIKGGNSNWRGPIWFPTTYLLVDALRVLHRGYENDISIRGKNIHDIAEKISKRMVSLFLKNEKGHIPIFGDYEKFQQDSHFNEYLLFFEHYHGDTGRGLGASHQTGWSGLVANLIDEWFYIT